MRSVFLTLLCLIPPSTAAPVNGEATTVDKEANSTTSRPPTLSTFNLTDNVHPRKTQYPGGIHPAPVISKRDARYESFELVDNILSRWMDTRRSPCDDFYHYACGEGNTNGMVNPFAMSFAVGIARQIAKYNDEKYFENAVPPLKQLKHFYDLCMDNNSTQEEAALVVHQKVGALKEKSGVNFPLLYQNETVNTLTPEDLGRLIGFAISEAGEGTLVKIGVAQDYKQPDTKSGRVYIDQPLLRRASDFEINRNLTLAMCKSVAILLGVEIDEEQLERDVEAVLSLDASLAAFYVTDHSTRRLHERMYNLRNLSDLQMTAPAFNWVQLVNAALVRANASEKISEDLEVVVTEPEMIEKLSSDILDGKFNASTIANYIHFRAAFATWAHLLKISPNAIDVSDETRENAIEIMKETLGSMGQLLQNSTADNNTALLTSLKCIMLLMETLPDAADRVLVDAVYPTEESRNKLRNKVTELSKYVIHGFRSQIDGLNWMSVESKKEALSKLDNILLNIAFPDWVTNDEMLTEAYKELSFTTNSTLIESFFSIKDFFLMSSVVNFRNEDARNRSFFYSPNYLLYNAAYDGGENAIHFSGGILNAPLFNTKFPMAFQYGGFGFIFGHELTHGFDDSGVQWDGVGAMRSWMDAESQRGFRKMADCVVRQYDETCPAITGKPCLDGVLTQGENIADNGGIRAAYSAFKTYESLHGPDPRLPSFGRVFNNDQLFFLGFAHTWCGADQSEDKRQSLFNNDTHSPPIYRVQATLQNFPAFRAAFNCPVGRVYSPKEHCNVWATPPFKPFN